MEELQSANEVMVSSITDAINRLRQEMKVLEDRIDVQTRIATASKLADEHIRNVFRQVPVSIIVYNGPRYIIDLVNEKAVEEWGAIYKESIGKSVFDVSPALCEGQLVGMLDKVYKSGEPFIAQEFPVQISRDGKMYEAFFNFVQQPIFDLEGAITGITAVGAEVTQEVIARRKLEESEFRYQNLIYSSSSLVAILRGEEMIIEIANDAILESWGKGKDVVGKSLFLVMPEIIDQGFKEILQKVYTTGEPFYA